MENENLNAELAKLCNAAAKEKDSLRLKEFAQKIIELIDARKEGREDGENDSGFLVAS